MILHKSVVLTCIHHFSCIYFLPLILKENGRVRFLQNARLFSGSVQLEKADFWSHRACTRCTGGKKCPENQEKNKRIMIPRGNKEGAMKNGKVLASTNASLGLHVRPQPIIDCHDSEPSHDKNFCQNLHPQRQKYFAVWFQHQFCGPSSANPLTILHSHSLHSFT